MIKLCLTHTLNGFWIRRKEIAQHNKQTGSKVLKYDNIQLIYFYVSWQIPHSKFSCHERLLDLQKRPSELLLNRTVCIHKIMQEWPNFKVILRLYISFTAKLKSQMLNNSVIDGVGSSSLFEGIPLLEIKWPTNNL